MAYYMVLHRIIFSPIEIPVWHITTCYYMESYSVQQKYQYGILHVIMENHIPSNRNSSMAYYMVLHRIIFHAIEIPEWHITWNHIQSNRNTNMAYYNMVLVLRCLLLNTKSQATQHYYMKPMTMRNMHTQFHYLSLYFYHRIHDYACNNTILISKQDD